MPESVVLQGVTSSMLGSFCPDAYHIQQGSTLAVFRYPEPPRFPDGIPDSPEQ